MKWSKLFTSGQPARKAAVRDYGLALLSVAVATALRALLDPALGSLFPFLFYFIALGVTASFTGLGPSLVAMVLGFLVSDWLFVPPRHTFAFSAAPELLGLALYCSLSLCLLIWAQGMRRAKVQAQAGAQSARLRQQELEKVMTERQQAQEALQRADAQLRAFFQTAAVGLAQTDLGGRFVQANDRFCELTGYSREELLEKTAPDLSPPEDRARDREQFAPYLQGRVPVYAVEKRYCRKDGTLIWVQVTAGMVRDAQGKPLLSTGIAQDITGRKRAEAALLESEERYRSLFKHMTLGFFLAEVICDDAGRPVDYRYLDANPAFEPLTALHWEHAIGRTAREVLPGIEPFWIETYGQVALSGQSVRLEQFAAPLGRYYNTVAYSPRPGQFACLFEDITERKRAEAALRQAQEEALRRAQEAEERERILSAMMEHIPMGITIAEAPDVRVRMVSRFGRELLAKRHEDLTGTVAPDHPAIWGIYHTDGVTLARPEELPLTRATQQGEIVQGEEWVVKRSDGTLIPFLCTAAPIRDSRGRILGGVIGWQDMTERKRAEAALREAKEQLARANEDLEGKVRERTASLREMIAELEHFSYSITHDMRAPLRAMRSFAGMLLKECSDCLAPSGRDYLQRIATAAERMDQLVVDALDYSKALRQELPLAPVDPEPLLRGMIESYPALQPPQAHIQIDGPMPKVLANPAGLTQCFSNLLSNAVKFVAPGTAPRVRVWAGEVQSAECGVRNEKGGTQEMRGGESGGSNGERRRANVEGEAQRAHDLTIQPSNDVTLSAHHPPSTPQPSTSSGWVRIWFEDNGIGIAKEHQHRIFDMFQQLDKSCEGTGIGLALVRKNAERMGGKVGVESEPGQGSRFWIELEEASTAAGERS